VIGRTDEVIDILFKRKPVVSVNWIYEVVDVGRINERVTVFW